MTTHRVIKAFRFLGLGALLFGSIATNARAAPLQELRSTSLQCELIGLGAINTVPYNFPGLSADAVARDRVMNPGIVETSLPAGANPNAPAILGGDLGSPFVHADGKLYFQFGDSWFDGWNRVPRDPNCQSNCDSQVGLTVNDDLLASVDLSTLSANSACIPLDMPRRADTGQVVPITWNGPANDGGHALGGGVVPAPGFSTGRYMFILAPRDAPACGATNLDCAAANGLASDVCLPAPDGVQRCYFGTCSADDSDAACALRLNPSQLIVRREGSDFTDVVVGEHVSSSHVFDGYRGHFSTVSFFSQVDFETGDGKVWVVGRDTYWGAPGLSMSPYLMYHPVHAGQLDEPLFFAGIHDGEPTFSPKPDDARPIYEESKLLSNHTSLMFEPALDGGTWLLLYGGHAQPALRSTLANYVRPVVDALFYDQIAGVYLRTAKQPWGPWSEPLTIWSPFAPGQSGYCEQMYFEDPQGLSGFTCPPDSEQHNRDLNRAPGLGMGAAYGAALVPNINHSGANDFTLHWLISTWNPYRVIMLSSSFELDMSDDDDISKATTARRPEGFRSKNL